MSPEVLVLAAFDRLNTRNNLVSLVELRRELPTLSRSQQDNAIRNLRKAMILSASALEGRHGITAAERSAAIPEGEQLLGFLSRR